MTGLDDKTLRALTTGFERLSSWADILDRINVYPVADGDTGRNLVITLLPLRQGPSERQEIIRRIILSARGNSGNIAAAFLSAFIRVLGPGGLAEASKMGRDAAWKSVPNPREGTILDVFDALDGRLEKSPDARLQDIVEELEKAVHLTKSRLPQLMDAGVVDSGALGMFVFLDGFFHDLSGGAHKLTPLNERFAGSLNISTSWRGEPESGTCVDAAVSIESQEDGAAGAGLFGDNEAISIKCGDLLKVHFHAPDVTSAMDKIRALGKVVTVFSDDLGRQTAEFRKPSLKGGTVVISDGAGSISRPLAREKGILLLDSYIAVGDEVLQETMIDSQFMYRLMRKGVKVSTSQASTFERHQCYQKALAVGSRAVYLCVGSAFTGNYQVAKAWKAEFDREDRFTVIDTGAASGRLALIALKTAEMAAEGMGIEELKGFALWAIDNCVEHVFIDRLTYLARGGRIPRAGAFFGDLVRMKPIISPMPGGVRRLGVARNLDEQIKFALDGLDDMQKNGRLDTILFQYSDNEDRIVNDVMGKITSKHPSAMAFSQPLSNTSGAHMGPGTWALAFIPEYRPNARVKE